MECIMVNEDEWFTKLSKKKSQIVELREVIHIHQNTDISATNERK